MTTEPPSSPLAAIQERYTAHIRHLLDRPNVTDASVDLALPYPDTEEIEVLKFQVDDLKKCLDSLRPIPPEQAENMREALDTKYTFDSNRIEGNTLTLQETAMVTLHGATIGGKPLKDHLEAINHRDALQRVRHMVENREPFNVRALLDLHADHVFPNPVKLPDLVQNLFADYERSAPSDHLVILAARMHADLVNIHPFADGNGRTARLFMNHILLANGYVIANISGESAQRMKYYAALEGTHSDPDMADFIRFILKTEKASLMEYIGMLDPEISRGRGGYFLERIAPYLP
jgi:Fic family protein